MAHEVIRKRTTLHGATATTTINTESGSLHNFASNDYLGLSQHPENIQALTEAAKEYGVASGGSAYMCGYSELHQQLETELATLTKTDQAIIFSSGYLANIGAVTSLCDAGTYICVDKNIHASLIDAILLSRAKFSRHKHLDCQALRNSLQRKNQRPCIVIAEGIYSMDGDSTPLAAYAKASSEHDAVFMLDDAHGFATFNAAGSIADYGLTQQQVPLMTATLGKSIGASGAFVAGRKDLMEQVAQKARSLIYSTALPPALVAASLAAIKISSGETGNQARQALQNAIKLFKGNAKQHHIPLLESNSPIQLVPMPDQKTASKISEALKKAGFFVPAIRYPTVPKGEERLRISLNAKHTEQQIHELIRSIAANI